MPSIAFLLYIGTIEVNSASLTFKSIKISIVYVGCAMCQAWVWHSFALRQVLLGCLLEKWGRGTRKEEEI